MKSNCCDAELVFREYGKRKLKKGFREMLLNCPVCGEKYQCREGDFSHPYQTKKKSTNEIRTVTIVKRITESRKNKIIQKWGSVSFFIDNG